MKTGKAMQEKSAGNQSVSEYGIGESTNRKEKEKIW